MDGTDSQAAQRLVAGRYRLTDVLGRGGMGIVWRATDELIGRTVAVKELRAPHGLSEGERAVFGERALREARTAGQVRHPGVIAIHDLVPSTSQDQAAYVVMELVEAPSLATVLEQHGALPEWRVVRLGVRVLEALDAAHAIGLVHRDVKPSNILVLPDDEVKLVDFGIAHAIDDTRLTRHGVAGSTGYIAPELFEGERPSPASDLWSLGVTLCHVATGRSPFERTSTASTIHAILYEDPPPLDDRPSLAPVITGLLTRDPNQRMTGREAAVVLRAAPASAPDAAGEPTRQGAGPGTNADGGSGTDGERATWEDQPTTVRTDSVPPKRSGARSDTTEEPSTGEEPKDYAVSPSDRVKSFNDLSLMLLAALIGWASWRLFQITWGWPVWAVIPAAGVLFLVAQNSVRAPWWGRFTISADGITVVQRDSLLSVFNSPLNSPVEDGKCLVAWEHITEVVLVHRPSLNFTDLAGRTGILLRMAASTPAEVRSKPPFGGVDRAGPGNAFAWSLGETESEVDEVKAALRAAAPPEVTISSPSEPTAEESRYYGPRRTGLLLWVLLLAGVLVGTYVFPRHDDGPVRLTDSGWYGQAGQAEFSPDGTTLASSTLDDGIELWDIATRKSTATLSGHTGKITALRFNPSGSLLASADDDHTIKVWDTTTHAALKTLTVGKDVSAVSLVFSPDNRTLASVNDDRTIALWGPYTGRKTVTIAENTPNVVKVAFSSDGRALSGIDNSNTAHRWDSSTGHSVSAADTGGKDWAGISASDPDTIDVRDSSGSLKQTLSGHTDKITTWDWARPDLNLLATSSEDHTIRIWHTDTGETATKLSLNADDGTTAEALALSPDGTTLAYGNSTELWLWKTGIHS